MEIYRYLLLSFIVIFLLACRNKNKETDLLEQAAIIHNEAINMANQLEPTLEIMIQLKNALLKVDTILSHSDSAYIKKVTGLEQSFSWFHENHVEVPGYEHEHDHEGHDHSHDHGPKLELSAQDMLSVQREFRDTIKKIKQLIEDIN